MKRVLQLIEGFESPYGMELLASVHWVVTQDMVGADCESALAGVQAWNERKRQLMKPEHVRLAWTRLHDEGWLAHV